MIVTGSEEHPDNIRMAEEDAKWLRKADALVVHHAFEGMGHSFPRGYRDHLMIWSRFLVALAEKVPK